MNKHLRQLGYGFVNMFILAAFTALTLGLLFGGIWLFQNHPLIFSIPFGVIILLVSAYIMGDYKIEDSGPSVPWEGEEDDVS